MTCNINVDGLSLEEVMICDQSIKIDSITLNGSQLSINDLAEKLNLGKINHAQFVSARSLFFQTQPVRYNGTVSNEKSMRENLKNRIDIINGGVVYFETIASVKVW